MRKQTKIAAIVSAAALLAIGASMTSLAAEGWMEENGTWSYYNRFNEKVTEQWQKSGDKWFWLNADGNMATDSIVQDNENYFYVDANGVMVTNRWVEVDNSTDDAEDAPPTVWYYFQANGKAYKGGDSTSFKTINGKNYAFAPDGRMLFGWVDGNSNRVTGEDAWQYCEYYLGGSDDGSRASAEWRQIHVTDSSKDDPEQDYWFYFQANGKKYTNKFEGQTVNGRKYAFGEFGNMLYKWVGTPSGATLADQFKNFSSTNEDGSLRTKTWFKAVPDEAFDRKNSEAEEYNEKWYYADAKGRLAVSEIKTINGRKYAFDEKGAMISGLWYLSVNESNKIATGSNANEEIDSESKLDKYTKVTKTSTLTSLTRANDKTGLYYFGDESDGSMKTGNVNVSIDGDSYAFKFATSGNKGVGIDGMDGNLFFVNGKKIKADSEDKYKVYVVTTKDRVIAEADSNALVDSTITTEKKGRVGSDHSYVKPAAEGVTEKCVVVSSSGALQGRGTKKDGNDINLVSDVNKKLVGAYRQD